jgi:SAM-dependent methyltransferase
MQVTITERAYLLGHDDPELERLRRQSDFYAPLTAQALRLAGIQPGMRVLDAGCGIGGVSTLIARLVGPTGEVIAVDQSPAAIARAALEIEQAGLTNVHLVHDDLATLQLDAPVDAIVGRLILMHVGDPVAVLRNLAAGLNRPGIVLFQEIDIGVAHSEPPVPLVESKIELVRQAFARSGVDPRPGMRLHDQFIAAGLPAPQLVSLGRIEAPPARTSAALLTGVLTTLLPALEATGLATADELRLDTLPERVSAEVSETGSFLFTPPLITAWTRVEENTHAVPADERS